MTDTSTGSSTEPAADPARTLADRYGRGPRRRLVVIVGAVVVSVAFLGWLAWSTWSYATPEIRSELVSFEVTGEHEAVARVDVHLTETGAVATCTVRAIAVDHTTVGAQSFTVPGPDGVRSGTVEVPIRTERRATSVDLLGCTTPGQSRPR